MRSNRRPLKSLGQNFLIDRNIVFKIIASAGLVAGDAVLEVGPGRGALTEILAEQVSRLTLVEYDHVLAQTLQDRFSGDRRVTVVDGDILAVDLGRLLEPAGQGWKIIANLPYNISTQVLFRFLEMRAQVSRMVLMLQKEVGDRLVAAPGSSDYGVTTLLLGLWFDIRREFVVAPGCFHPRPKVDSVVLSFMPLSQPRFDVGREDIFRNLVKGAFAMRRKTLGNCLKKALLGVSVEQCAAVLGRCGIDGGRRGETLSLEEFARLSRSFSGDAP